MYTGVKSNSLKSAASLLIRLLGVNVLTSYLINYTRGNLLWQFQEERKHYSESTYSVDWLENQCF